jgi:hypothetical protein
MFCTLSGGSYTVPGEQLAAGMKSKVKCECRGVNVHGSAAQFSAG